MIFYSVKGKNRSEYMIMMNPSTFVSTIASRCELLPNNPCPVVSSCLMSVWRTVVSGLPFSCHLVWLTLPVWGAGEPGCGLGMLSRVSPGGLATGRQLPGPPEDGLLPCISACDERL